MDWRDNLVEDTDGIAAIVRAMKRIAVLGIKTEREMGQPAIEIPRYLIDAGYDVVPVPVYFPDVTTILGRQVYRSVSSIPGGVDLVDVFRRSPDVGAHVPDLVAAKPRVVWLQSGIRNAVAAEQLARAGIKVVQDRCLMVEHRHVR